MLLDRCDLRAFGMIATHSFFSGGDGEGELYCSLVFLQRKRTFRLTALLQCERIFPTAPPLARPVYKSDSSA